MSSTIKESWREMIIGQLHHGITVSDIDKAVEWYCEVLGLELVHRQRQDNAYTPVLVGVPGAVLEVAQLRIPSALPTLSTHQVEIIQYVEQRLDGSPAPVNQVGTAHLAFLVTDIELLYRRASASGATFRNPPVTITEGANAGGAGTYLHDPDGNTLEFVQPSASRLTELRLQIDRFASTA